MMQILEFIKNRLPIKDFEVIERVECNDGFSMSCQVHCGSYTYPKRFNKVDEIVSLEVGFPNYYEEDLMEYIENYEEDPEYSVYGYVPVEIVEKIVEKHGGIYNLN